MNYTNDLTTYIVEEYKSNPSTKTVDKLADELGRALRVSLVSYQEKEYINVLSIQARPVKHLLRKWSWCLISLRIWTLRLRIWWVSIKVQRQLSKRWNSLRGHNKP